MAAMWKFAGLTLSAKMQPVGGDPLSSHSAWSSMRIHVRPHLITAMDLTAWFPPLTTTALFAAALWLGRNIISTRLTKSVEHEFNTKLESVRSQRESEERLKAENPS